MGEDSSEHDGDYEEDSTQDVIICQTQKKEVRAGHNNEVIRYKINIIFYLYTSTNEFMRTRKQKVVTPMSLTSITSYNKEKPKIVEDLCSTDEQDIPGRMRRHERDEESDIDDSRILLNRVEENQSDVSHTRRKNINKNGKKVSSKGKEKSKEKGSRKLNKKRNHSSSSEKEITPLKKTKVYLQKQQQNLGISDLLSTWADETAIESKKAEAALMRSKAMLLEYTPEAVEQRKQQVRFQQRLEVEKLNA